MIEQETTNRQLPDGTRLLVRDVRPGDRELLQVGFQHFGPASRYRRFLMNKDELSDSELQYLTEVDGSDHFAIGAVTFDAEGVAQPVGIARYVRLQPGGEVAEPAVAVVDEMQGKGVGKLLLHELSDAAYARGVRCFRCSVLSSNAPMSAVLEELDPPIRLLRSGGGVDELEIDVPAPQAVDAQDAPRKRMEHLLRLIAEKLVSWVPARAAG
jgi:GNAT superfamily N-acetyltransferase